MTQLDLDSVPQSVKKDDESLGDLLKDTEEAPQENPITEDNNVNLEEAANALNEELLSEFLGASKEVAGMELRSMTLADAAILQRSKSAFLMGVDIDTIEEPIMEICKFLALMDSGITVKEASKLAKDAEALDDAAIQVASTIAPKDVSGMIGKIVGILMEATATQVTPVSSPDDPAPRGKQ